jgi:transcriptional regulator with XRE-family HTH domain
MLWKENQIMQRLSQEKLAQTVKERRNEKGWTQQHLGDLTSIHRLIVGRIENGNFLPSIIQLEALSEALGFNIPDLFVDKQPQNSFVALRSEALSENEREGVDTLFRMMLSLRQQIVLRGKFAHEAEHRS